MNAETVAGLRLAGIDPDRLVDRRNHTSAPPVDIVARRRELIAKAANEYVLADRHVVSVDPWVDDELERIHVRSQHGHPFFFAASHPIPAAAPMVAAFSPKAAAVVIAVWVFAPPLMLIGYGGLLEWAKRIGSRHAAPPLTLAERLQADQRRHLERWANHEEDDVA